MRGKLTQVHLADLHFAAFDPRKQLEILTEQCLNVINQMPSIDLISIDGDFFDHKMMSNSDGIMYGCIFMEQLIQIAKAKGSTVIVIAGTQSHDSDQLKLFYHYIDDPGIDIRIVTTLSIQFVKGAKILCIPELYGLDEKLYQEFLSGPDYYDAVFMHGTFEGAVYGNNVGNGRLFTMNDFSHCRGPIISGHVHVAGCFQKYFYYTGSPYRWKFGEEQEKGFLIVLQDLDTGYHYTHFQKIESFRYDTIYLDELVSNDPKKVIDFITSVKRDRNIDFIKIKFRCSVDGSIKTILNNYYRNSKQIFLEYNDSVTQTLIDNMTKDKNDPHTTFFEVLNDEKLSPYEKLVWYINFKEQDAVISVNQLKSILEESV